VKKTTFITFLIAGSAVFISACSEMAERRQPASPEVPPGPSDSTFQGVLDSNGQPLATKGASVPDGQIYIFSNAKIFILSSRGTNSSVFSTQIPMKHNGQVFGSNCTFESTDCSGECRLDGNHGQPDQNALLVANNWDEVEGQAARVYQYDGSAISSQVIEIRSRMDLYGFGPYCSPILGILDHHYTLTDVTALYPNLNNTGWTIQY
jgi:hypothetical protein